MKQYILIPLMVMLICFSCKNTTPLETNEVAPKATLDFPDPRKGTQFNYSFEEKDKQTPIQFYIQNLESDIDFVYHISNSSQKEGGFHISNTLKESAFSSTFDFVNINTIDLDQIGLLIGKNKYNELIDNGKMEYNLGKGTKNYYFSQNEDVLIKHNGKSIYISTIKITDEKQSELFWIYKHINFPLIIKAETDVKFQLVEWIDPKETVS